MADNITDELDEYINQLQASDVQRTETTTPTQREHDFMRHSRASFDEFSTKLVEAVSDDRSVISNLRSEDWTFTGFPEDLPLPTADNHGRRYSIDDANLNLATFGEGQTEFVAEREDSHAAQEHITHWLDRLPDANVVGEENMTKSLLGFGSSSEESSVRPVSFNEVNVALAKRDRSAFLERSGGPWELRRPSEVQERAQTQWSSQSSWGSDEGPRLYRRGFDNIDWDVVDELKGFSFTSPRRGRRVTRPDFPPMSPRAVGCRLWPERPDLSASQGQGDIFHVHATVKPSVGMTNEVQPAKNDRSPILCSPPQPRKWFSWMKG
ncbi:MAG: hypothetical protein Q9225_002182 [Loekoesia sp. 1 TL-2023]